MKSLKEMRDAFENHENMNCSPACPYFDQGIYCWSVLKTDILEYLDQQIKSG